MNPQDNPPNKTGNGVNELSLPPVDPGQTPQPTTPAPVQAQPKAVRPASAASSTIAGDGTPLIADDNDLIEKEWVEKAKQLVDQTKNDPFKQNKEISKFKAEYIKKRYNKDIQLRKD